ncbi:MAG: hypothetical protein E6G91_06180 [Alphaproteobacteria bacterium]|nr:MAG: hypothetical protein E6G91_06180 [Alphaproteobacteria bacterium]
MCTSIVEIVAAEGMAKREDEWFPLTHASVAYDHARHALLADVITLDFINEALPRCRSLGRRDPWASRGIGGERAGEVGREGVDCAGRCPPGSSGLSDRTPSACAVEASGSSHSTDTGKRKPRLAMAPVG